MTKKEAWEQIAAAFALAAEGGERSIVTRYGLCNAVVEVVSTVSGSSVWMDYIGMGRDLDEIAPRKCRGFWWPLPGDDDHTPDCDHERAMLAQLLAESSEDI